MTFADLVRGASFFVDANIFVFHFQPHALFGLSCTDLLQRFTLGLRRPHTDEARLFRPKSEIPVQPEGKPL